MIKLSYTLGFLLFFAFPTLHAAPQVTNGTAIPSQVRIGAASKVQFYVDIGDPTLIAGSVNLQRAGAVNTNPAILGILRDDGTGGDEIAGDGRYSIEITLNEPAASDVTFVISAAFRGQILRARSGDIVVSAVSNRPPVAVPGSSGSVLTGTAITLDGRQSFDLDGDLLSFSWSLTAKPAGSNASFDNSTFVKPRFTPDVAGTYRASLIVNDGQVSSAAGDVLILAAAENAAPTAIISGTLQLPFGAATPATAQLNANSSFDPEGSVLTYRWRIVSRPASSLSPAFSPLTSATPVLTADKPGRYVVELIVNDGVNDSAPMQATVIFFQPNTPPTLSAGTDQIVTSPAPVNLLSIASDADAGDTIASLGWAFIAKPAGSTATLQNPATSTPSFTPDALGDYLIELTAVDSRGVANRARVVVRRAAPGPPVNQPPTVSITPVPTVTLPATASLLATAADDGLPLSPGALSITWIAVSGPTGVTFSNPNSLATTATFYGTGTFVLRVTASDGALSASRDVAVGVTATGPQFAALSDRTIPLGTRFQAKLAANSNDLFAALTYSLDAAPSGAVFNPRLGIDWTPTADQVGTNTFTARVVDGAGRFDTKTFHITVTNANRPPVMADQPDASVVLGSQFTRVLTATDPDSAETLTFALVAGPAGMTLDGATLNWTAAGVAFSMAQVLVKVTDHAGAIDSKSFLLSLLPGTPPVAADDDYSIKLGATLTIPAQSGVLANDANPMGLPLTATKLSDPSKGTLSAFGSDGSFTYQAPPTLPGPVFQPVVKTNIELVSVLDTNPIVADLDGDGKAEIIVSNGILIRAYHEDGSLLWAREGALPEPYSDCNVASSYIFSISVGDVDDDGKPDVVFSVSCGRDSTHPGQFTRSRFGALNGLDGSIKWISPPLTVLTVPTGPNYDQPGLAARSSPTIARLRPNETPSVLLAVDASGVTTVGVDSGGNAIVGPACMHIQQTVSDGTYHYPDASAPGHYFACRGLFVLNGSDGTIRQTMIVSRGSLQDLGYEFAGNPAPIVVDLNQDGTLEIVSGSVVFNLNGGIVFHGVNSGTGETAAGNFDDTPDIEVVRYEHIFQTSPDFLSVYKSNGTILWQLPFPKQTVVSKLTVADIDGSGRPSIVLNLYSNVCAIDYRGSLKWCYDTMTDGNLKVNSRSRHAVFDIDSDGIPEVIVSAADKLLFLDGVSGRLKYSFDTFTIPSSSPPDKGSGYNTPGVVVSDTDGSGHARVVFTWVGGGARITILKNQTDDWPAVRQIMNQAAYFVSNVNDNGTIPQLPLTNNFATPATNVYGTQPRIGAPVDRRQRTSTSFTYQANAGTLSSSPATVNLTILPVNRPPVFTSVAPTRYLINAPFTYVAHAVDPDVGDTVHYSLSYYFSGDSTCVIDAISGVLNCGSAGAVVGQFAQITVVATDNQGDSTTQTVLMTGAAGGGNVPNVVGLTQAGAQASITIAGFTVGAVTQVFSGAPSGQVVGQSPAGSSNLLSGELVSLTLSQGPAPIPVPPVTGQSQTVAVATLTAAGFSAPVTHVFSNTVPANTVISQLPVAGTVLTPIPANAVALTVSAGTGLQLRLNRSVTTSDQLITVTPLVTDVDGNALPIPPLSYSIAAKLTPFAGPLPGIAGTTITPGATTQGSFTLTALDSANSRSASVDFAILPPRIPGHSTHGGSIAGFVETLDSIHAFRAQLTAARDAQDTAQMKTLLQQMVTIWRTLNLDDLKLSLPVVAADKFVPSVDDLTALGLSATPADLRINQILLDACDDIQAATDALNDSGSSVAQVNSLVDRFSTRAARLDGLTVSEFGGIYNKREYTRLVSHRIPAFYDALMNLLGKVTGMASRPPGLIPFARGSRATAARKPVHANETLAEIAVTEAVNLVVDKAMENAAQTYKNAKEMAVDVMQQGAWTAAAVGIAAHLKEFVLGGDIVGIVAGASLSIHEFNEPDQSAAFLEVNTDALDPHISTVMVIGPEIINDAANGVKETNDNMKDAFSYGLDPANNPKRIKNLNQAKDLMTELYNKLLAVKASVDHLQDAIDNAYQTADTGLYGCLFSDAKACSELVYSNGLAPVYRFKPPDGFESLSGLPVGIVFIVQSDSGMMYFAVASFMPAPPKE